MAWRCGSLSRSFISSARGAAAAASVRSSPTLPRVRPSSFTAPLPQQPRSFSFTNLRSFAELGCTQSLLPLHSVVAASRLTSHLTVDARACCELSQGTLCRSCQDR